MEFDGIINNIFVVEKCSVVNNIYDRITIIILDRLCNKDNHTGITHTKDINGSTNTG